MNAVGRLRKSMTFESSTISWDTANLFFQVTFWMILEKPCSISFSGYAPFSPTGSKPSRAVMAV